MNKEAVKWKVHVEITVRLPVRVQIETLRVQIATLCGQIVLLLF